MKGRIESAHHDAPQSHAQNPTEQLVKEEVKRPNSASLEISNNPIVYLNSALQLFGIFPPSPPQSRPQSRIRHRTLSEEMRMADATLSHILLMFPNDSQTSSDTNDPPSPLKIASPAALVRYMEERPDEFRPDDRKRIYATILHHSLFAFDERTNSANFPLVLRTINSLTPTEHANAIREGDELLSKMAASMLKHIHEGGQAIAREASVLEKLGLVYADLQHFKDRVIELEGWKTEREDSEAYAKAEWEAAKTEREVAKVEREAAKAEREAAKVEREAAGKAAKANQKLAEASKAKITVLTVEKSQIIADLAKKKKEVDVARQLVNSLMKRPVNESILLMAAQQKEMEDRHTKELMDAEGQLFEAEDKCRDLEMQVRLMRHMREVEQAGDDGTGGAQPWKNKFESSIEQNNLLVSEKTVLEQRLDDRYGVIQDLQSQLDNNRTMIASLTEQVVSLSHELVGMRAKDANQDVELVKLRKQISDHGADASKLQNRFNDLVETHGAHTSKLQNQINSLVETMELKDIEIADLKRDTEANRAQNAQLRLVQDQLLVADAQSQEIIAKLRRAVDAVALRSFQDKLIIGMAFISRIIPSTAKTSTYEQNYALNEFLSAGRQSYPTRYIDLICLTAVVLEEKKKFGILTNDEKGFAELLASDEAICQVYDFALSDASWTRLSGNVSAHPHFQFDELEGMISRSVHTDEHSVATRCAAAYQIFWPDEDANHRTAMAAILEKEDTVDVRRRPYVMTRRHDEIVRGLNYYRTQSKKMAWWKVKPLH